MTRDCGSNGALVIRVISPTLFFVDSKGIEQRVLPGNTIPANTTAPFDPKRRYERQIAIGECVSLTENDLHDVAYTLYAYISEIVESADRAIHNFLGKPYK